MSEKKVIKIAKSIIGQAVRPAAVNDAHAAAAPIDVDPRRVQIEGRKEGAFESVNLKYTLHTGEGSKAVFFNIGFSVVCGVIGGTEYCIERPLEFFYPTAQSGSADQWISATMRSLSRAARAGYAAKALEDLREVDAGAWIRLGEYPNGKPRFHKSEVAAIAWAMQHELFRRGFLDEHYIERSVEEMAERYSRVAGYRELIPVEPPQRQAAAPAAAGPEMAEGMPVVARCPHNSCGGPMILKDGCPTCTVCSYSKCG